MGFKERTSLDSDVTISLGGVNKKTNKANPKSIEGYYLGFREVESKKSSSGTCKLHFFKTPKGNVGVWGKTDLDRKLIGVAVGTMTRATFDKMKPVQGKNDMYSYKVETDDDNVIEAESVSAESADAESEDSNGEAYGSEYGEEDEMEAGVEEAAPDELPMSRPTRRPALPPSADRQKKVQDLLNKARSKQA